jgi:hypothetical protein
MDTLVSHCAAFLTLAAVGTSKPSFEAHFLKWSMNSLVAKDVASIVSKTPPTALVSRYCLRSSSDFGIVHRSFHDDGNGRLRWVSRVWGLLGFSLASIANGDRGNGSTGVLGFKGFSMRAGVQDFDQLPLYGCLTGFTLPVENFEIGPGLLLRRTFVDTFAGWNMGLVVPGAPTNPHPASVRDEARSMFKARAELAITQTSLDGFTDTTAIAWLVASLMRLQIKAPVRLVVLATMPFDTMADAWQRFDAVAFETGIRQWSEFRDETVQANLEDLLWLRRCLPIAARLYQDERFQRAFSIYDEALWNGVLGGITGLAGLPVTVWCGLRGWPKDRQRAIFQPVAVAIFLMSAAWLGIRGVVSADTIRLFLLGLPALLADTWLGMKLYGRLDDATCGADPSASIGRRAHVLTQHQT